MAKQDPRTLSESADTAAIASLRYVNDAEPGLRRRRTGAGFGYRDAAGHAVTDRATLARIRALAIPPAYEDVWICADPRGHIQATGHDDAGRKQYIYHDAWREHRDREKFQEMEDFAGALPGIRERIADDLARRGLVRERSSAARSASWTWASSASGPSVTPLRTRPTASRR